MKTTTIQMSNWNTAATVTTVQAQPLSDDEAAKVKASLQALAAEREAKRAEKKAAKDRAEWYRRCMLRMCANSELEGDRRGVYAANPEDKQAARALEKKGLVTIERTKERDAGLQVWYVKLAAKAAG